MAKQKSILLAEDDDNLGQLLQTFLKAKGYQVELARNGKHAYEKYTDGHFDFCIFDVMMPEMDGFTLAKEVRLIDPKIPILFLTAKAMKEDKLEGFESGADDYMTKPFTMEELLARIEAILRRTGGSDNEESEMQQIGTIQYEPVSRILHLKEEDKKLTTKEGQLLHLLCKNRNEVLDRQAALRAIWGDDNYFNGRSMDVYIAKLRKLLKEDERIEILNIHGKGFKLIVHE
ncbi:response regulator transcription factor [Fluviicola chungangensis]|uniref:Response regulator transcription factor n=1 Tax=Fluviicola chungangensis TaxID=2597671 RepID=A0A556N384_9FLAO|nr:response regulator transcription factor [Fluviicola chungangensis]TSJ46498.1 response regulator transcription factor [Fluviicola chungangensis]